MKPRLVARGLSLVLLFASAALPGRAASFSAELVDTRGGETHTGPFSLQDQNYRFEMVENGQALLIIGDGASGAVRLLDPSEKLYLEAGPDEPISRMMSPFAFFAFYARTREVRAEGTESIDGVPCTKQVAFAGEQVFATAWISEKHSFPLKVEVPIDSRTVELRNIKPGPQDAALFAVPADYQPAPKAGEPPPPEWAAQVPGAPVLTPPFEQTLAEGAIIRVRPQAGSHIRLQGTNPASETCAFTSVGFKDGRPLSDPSYGTVNLEPEQEVTAVHSEGPAEADDIVVRVRNGKVKIKADFVAADASPGPVSAPPEDASTPTVPPELSAAVDAPNSAAMASRFEVLWSGPANSDDYISVARPNQPPGAYVSLTRVREGNPLKLWAPSEPGEFEVRYILARGAKLLAKTPIKINAVTAKLETVGLAKVADWIEVTWEGPAGESDYISVALPNQPPGAYANLTRVSQGNPVRVRAPSDPGEYEVRYILGRGAKLLAKTPVTIEGVTATVEAPATVVAGADFQVRWTGPGYAEDYIAVARENQPPGANLGVRPTRQGNPAKLRAPKEPGIYEVRYLLGRGNRLLAKTTISITAPTPP